MEQKELIVSACFDMIKEDRRYRENTENHKNCEACLSCKEQELAALCLNLGKFTCSSVIKKILLNSSGTSAERIAYPLRIKAKVSCRSCNFYSEKQQIFEKLVVNDTFTQSELRNILISSRPPAECPVNCSSPNPVYKSSLSSPHGSYFLQILWKTRSLKSLLNFILSTSSMLDLDSFYRSGGKKYLKGMLLQNYSMTAYINLESAEVITKYGRSYIYINYLLFMMLQYSLFPVVLVYAEEELTSWEDQVRQWGEELVLFYQFLIGENIVSNRICFICWNQSHDRCEDFRNPWICHDCRKFIPANYIFCYRCNAGRRPVIEGEDYNTCRLCQNELRYTYCNYCSVIAQCGCGRKIHVGQQFACNQCNSVLSSMDCSVCGYKEINKFKCLICLYGEEFNPNPLCYHGISIESCIECNQLLNNPAEPQEPVNQFTSLYCAHNEIQHDCKLCLFDFTCAVCFKAKLVYEPRVCWHCKSDLLGKVCRSCPKIIPQHSLVCKTCVSTLKSCRFNHIITKHSISLCNYCKEASTGFCNYCDSPKRPCPINHSACVECRLPLLEYEANCLLCKSSTPHNCLKYSACPDCYSTAKNFKALPDQSLLQATKSFQLNKVYLTQDRDWRCKCCNFSNESYSCFCEGCNISKNCSLTHRFTCEMCGRMSSSKICEYCYIECKCSDCFKNILVGQRQHCGQCGQAVIGRACGNCNSIVSRLDIVCFICSQMKWTCVCGKVNKRRSEDCINCQRTKQVTCGRCGGRFNNEAWRGNSSVYEVVGDVFYCQSCRVKSYVCTCGCKAAINETKCQLCNELINQ